MPKKEKQGIVVSSKMDKTAVVKVSEFAPHPKYKKIIETTKNYKAHDANNECGEGDVVRIISTKPISKTKHFYLKEIVKEAVVI